MTRRLEIAVLAVLVVGGPSWLSAAQPRVELLGGYPSRQPAPVHLVVDVGGIIDSAFRGDVLGIVYHSLPHCQYGTARGYGSPGLGDVWVRPDFGYAYPYSPRYRAYSAYGEPTGLSANPPIPREPARIVNPLENGVALSFAIDGQGYTVPPGGHQDVFGGPSRVIAFDRSGSRGFARYALRAGTYTFAPSDKGWELYQGPAAQTEEIPTPKPMVKP